MKTYTKQEAFDIVWEHAKKKERAWTESDGCRLRANDGKKCFIGILIPDEEYAPSLETKVIMNTDYLDSMIIEPFGSLFLDKLRRIHDAYDPVNWAKHLRDFAKAYELKVPEEGSPA